MQIIHHHSRFIGSIATRLMTELMVMYVNVLLSSLCVVELMYVLVVYLMYVLLSSLCINLET
jgi:hypothetical protein